MIRIHLTAAFLAVSALQAACQSRQLTYTHGRTRYGSFTIPSTAARILLTETTKILNNISDAITHEVIFPAQYPLTEKERTILNAYDCADNTQQLTDLSTRAQMQNWPAPYQEAIQELITVSLQPTQKESCLVQ